MTLERFWVGCALALATCSAALANPRNLDWVDIGTNGPPGDPNTWAALPAPTNAQNGDAFFFMLDSGDDIDNNGGQNSHWDPEGLNAGAFRGQGWVRWDGLQSRLKAQCDTAFTTNAWTVRRMWVLYTPSNAFTANGPGILSFSEVSDLNNRASVADWGDQTQATTEAGGNTTTQLPAGYHGFFCQAILPVPQPPSPYAFLSFEILDMSGATQVIPTGTQAFHNFIVGPNSSILPTKTSFTLYHAPINDTTGGQGAAVALSFNGFLAGSFGLSPMLLIEVVKQNAVSTDSFPVPNNLSGEVAFSATAGTTCDFTLTAFDADTNDTLSFTITNPGSRNGSLAPNPPTATPTSDGMGHWSLPVRYTIPANVHGAETFTFNVGDGTVTLSATAEFAIRGTAIQNTIAYGAGTSDPFDAMRLYTGSAVANGGTSGTVDFLLGPPFAETVEFDNSNSLRHNPAGNLLGADFGSTASGGSVIVYATMSGCSAPSGSTPAGGFVAYHFDGSDVQHPLTRLTGLSVSPNNSLIALEGFDNHKMYILSYAVGPNVGHGGMNAASIGFLREIDMGAVWDTRTYSTKWFDNGHVLTVDPSGNLMSIDINDPNPPTATPFVASPYTANPIRVGSVEYNPEVAPNLVYITTSERTGTAPNIVVTNRIWVADLNAMAPATLGNGQTSADYSNTALGSGDEEFREIAFDCFGNLFIGVAVNTTNLINIKYLPLASQLCSIVGGFSTLTNWRSVATGPDQQSNFSGLDVAAATSITNGTACTTPPAATNVTAVVPFGGGSCVVNLVANGKASPPMTFSITSPGPNGGTLVAQGAPSQACTTWTQQAMYTPAGGFRGEECFSFHVNRGGLSAPNAGACMRVRGSVVRDTVVFGASKSDADANNRTVRVYGGAHTPNGGTAGSYDFYGSNTGANFTQSVEFDNYSGVRHNPLGNLLGLNFGTVAGGGTVTLFATQAVCNGNQGIVLFAMDGASGRPRNRLSGLSVSPDNTMLAMYGVDNFALHFLPYSTAANVGLGGVNAATVGGVSTITLTAAQIGGTSTSAKSLNTAWLDNSTVMYVDKLGNLWAVPSTGPVPAGPKVNCPKTITSPNNFSSADIEYNPDISPYVFVTVGESNTVNTLYVVDPRTTPNWTIVKQAGGVNFTNHGATGTGTFREIAFDSVGNLFVGTASSATNGIIIRYFPSAAVYPGGIANDSSVVWYTVPTGGTNPTFSFTGLDIALGGSAPCALAGDMNGDGVRNGTDIQLFTACFINAGGGGPTPPGCACADMASPSGTLDAADLTTFVTTLLQ